MLKEVGASGQISLGKRLAGQLFDVVFHADGRVEMLPMRAVAVAREAAPVFGAASGGWKTASSPTRLYVNLIRCETRNLFFTAWSHQRRGWRNAWTLLGWANAE